MSLLLIPNFFSHSLSLMFSSQSFAPTTALKAYSSRSTISIFPNPKANSKPHFAWPIGLSTQTIVPSSLIHFLHFASRVPYSFGLIIFPLSPWSLLSLLSWILFLSSQPLNVGVSRAGSPLYPYSLSWGSLRSIWISLLNSRQAHLIVFLISSLGYLTDTSNLANIKPNSWYSLPRILHLPLASPISCFSGPKAQCVSEASERCPESDHLPPLLLHIPGQGHHFLMHGLLSCPPNGACWCHTCPLTAPLTIVTKVIYL